MNLDAIEFPAAQLGDDEQWAMICIPQVGASRRILLGRDLPTAKRFMQLEFNERRNRGAFVIPGQPGKWSVVTRVGDTSIEDRYTVVIMPLGVTV